MRNLSFSVVYLIVMGATGLVLCSQHEAIDLVEGEGWQPGIATWYGPPNGDGSEGGACGYTTLVGQMPFASKVTAVGPVLYRGGKACGECYQVKCEVNGLCSQTPVTVVVTDECPGCTEAEAHFDLSGTAFSDMALPGQGEKLRNVGRVNISFTRVACNYPGWNIVFHVNAGSSAYWFSVLIEFEDGDGDLGAVYLKQAESETWEAMQHSWGANWALNSGGPLKAPFSIRLQSLYTGKTLTAYDVIPQNWQPNESYKSNVNYPALY